MRICAAADVHFPRGGREWFAPLARAMCESEADVIVLAGDVSVCEQNNYTRFLSLFDGFSGPKLFVPGNHDLWSTSRHPDTQRRYERSLRNIVQASGFHYLPGAPLCVGDVGFVGVAGWYDYAFRQTEAPQPDLRVASFRLRTGTRRAEVPWLGPGDGKPWEDLDDADYAAKALTWLEEGEQQQTVVWNDATMVDWGQTDAEVVERMVRDVQRDAAALSEARRLVGVCHFLPFREMVAAEGPRSDVAHAYCRAYLGSPRLGEAFQSDPRFRLVLCGHRHSQQAISVGDLVVANCSVGDQSAGPLVVALDCPGPQDQPGG